MTERFPIFVGSKSIPDKVAGAIAHAIREGRGVIARAAGQKAITVLVLSRSCPGIY